MSEQIRPASDAPFYFRRDEETARFYEIFFSVCRKYAVHWASASEQEKCFVEEITRVNCERDRAKRLGLPTDGIRKAFVS